MTRTEAWLFHSSNVLVAGTGLVYAWMIWLVEPDDPYAVVNHPLQPTLQHLHVLVAPALVFMGGVLWQRHVWARLRGEGRDRRRSGTSLALTLAPMVVSGYLIQTASDEGWRAAWVVVHLATSALWIAGSLVHVVVRRAVRARERDEGRSQTGEPTSGASSSPGTASPTLG
jgi:hypothetical protein